MQRWRIIVVIGGWMVVALEQVWFGRMTKNMWTDLDEDREQECMGYKNKISSDQETGIERIGVLMQRWRIIVVIGGWMVVALMRIRFTEQVWLGKMTICGQIWMKIGSKSAWATRTKYLQTKKQAMEYIITQLW